jgi:hypothetical protein
MQTRSSYKSIQVAISIALVLWVGFPSLGSCCEPILPLVQLLAGATLAGPALITKSLLCLFAAIAIKCGAFAVLERRLPFARAVLFMLIANVVSTVPGFLIAAFSGSGTVLLAIPLIGAIGWMLRRRLDLLATPVSPLRISGATAIASFVVFFITSVILYVVASNVSERNYATYWALKLLFVTLVACTGIVISAVLEECVVARLSRKSQGNLSFYMPVFRANYVTLGVILLVAAISMLPKRLHSPHFIAAWLHTWMLALGRA